MIENKEMEKKKRRELQEKITYLGISREEAKRIFEDLEDEGILEITCPQSEEPRIEYIAMRQIGHSGRYRGISYKRGNIVLNIRQAIVKTLMSGASIFESMNGLFDDQPVIACIKIFIAMLTAADLFTIPLNEEMSFVLVALWKKRPGKNQSVPCTAGWEYVNEMLKENNKDPMTQVRYNEVLRDLEEAGIIQSKKDEIWLRERVCIRY